MPRTRRSSFESVAPFPHRLNTEIKNPALWIDHATLCQLGESHPVSRVDQTILCPEINAGVVKERCTHLWLYLT